MFNLPILSWQFFISSFIVFAVLLGFIMLTGKRQFGQLTNNNFALLLMLAYALHSAIYASGNTFYAAIISVFMLISVNYFAYKFTPNNKNNNNKNDKTTIQAESQILIIDGMIFKDTLLKTGITNLQINGAIKKHGYSNINQVHLAILETNGTISIFANKKSIHEQQ